MKRFLSMLFLLMGLAAAAQADMSLGVGPFVGTTFGPDAGGLGGGVERESTVWGGQAVLQMTDRWSVELAGGTFEDWDDEELNGVYGVGDGGITPLTLTARYEFPVCRDNFRAYAGAGIGYYFYEDVDLEVRFTEPDAQNSVRVGDDPIVHMGDIFGYHAAGGLRWFIRENLELFLEYRYAWLNPHARIRHAEGLTPAGFDWTEKMEADFRDNDELPIGRIGLNYRFN